jgi:hypothetical protein
MANPKDEFGNEFEEGAFIQLTLSSNLIRGYVLKVKPGGIVVRGRRAGRDMRTMGSITVICDIDLPINPDTNKTACQLLHLSDEIKNQSLHEIVQELIAKNKGSSLLEP